MLNVGFSIAQLEFFLLILVRMTGLFILSPIFGQRNVPATFKIGFSLFLTVILINILPDTNMEYMNNIFEYALFIVKELAVGAILGYVTYAVISGLYIAGQIIDMQLGFGISNVMDPMTNIQVPLTSNFYYIYTLLIFLMLNGHHMIIEALFASFNIIPVGNVSEFGNNFLPQVIKLMSEMFIIAVRIAAPIIAAIFIVDIVLGVLSRTMPQMNVFMLGMPIKIVVGFIIMIITVIAGVGIAQGIINVTQQQIAAFLSVMAGG